MENVFAFFGCDHKAGTSQLALCAAEGLSRAEANKKIMLVHCDGATCEINRESGENLERLKPYIEKNLLVAEDLIRSTHFKDNLYILDGNLSPETVSLKPDVTQMLMGYLSKHFDYVLCDCGAEINYGTALGALFSAEKIYMVLAPSENFIRKYEWRRSLYSKLLVLPSKLIVNSYSENGIYSLDYIAERLNLSESMLLKVAKHPKGNLAELERKSLFAYPYRPFKRDIEKLVREFLCRNT